MTERELEISAYVDGELKPEQVRKIKRDIERDPRAAKLVRIHRKMTALLSAACAARFYVRAKPRLH